MNRNLIALMVVALLMQARVAITCDEARAAQRVEALAQLIVKNNPRSRCKRGSSNYRVVTSAGRYAADCIHPNGSRVLLLIEDQLNRTDPFGVLGVGVSRYLFFKPLAGPAQTTEELLRRGAMVMIEDYELASERLALIAERRTIEESLRHITEKTPF